MSANSKIEWADHTFNPWECQKVGPGCDIAGGVQ
jgi:protein gp37